MSTTKLDTSGVFHSGKIQSLANHISLFPGAFRFRKNGLEFRAAQPIAAWTEMTVDLLSPFDGQRIHGTGVVVACQGNRHAGYSVSMLFMNLSPESQHRLEQLAVASQR